MFTLSVRLVTPAGLVLRSAPFTAPQCVFSPPSSGGVFGFTAGFPSICGGVFGFAVVPVLPVLRVQATPPPYQTADVLMRTRAPRIASAIEVSHAACKDEFR